MKKLFIYGVLSFLVCHVSPAQTIDELIIASETLYKETNSKLVFPAERSSFRFRPYQALDSTYVAHEIQLKKLQKEKINDDLGLVFKANAQYNFKDDLDEETNNYTRSRIKTELEWNILRSGFVQNRHKAIQFDNEIAILQQQKNRHDKINWRRQFRIDYTYSINEELISLFQNKLDFLHSYFDILSGLYHQKRVKREDFINISQQILVTEAELENTQTLNHQIIDSVSGYYKNEKLPILFIKNISRINTSSNVFTDSIQIENIRLKHHWLNNISFSVYTNYNWLQTNMNQRDFASAGLRLRMPLSFKRRRQIEKIEILRGQAIRLDKQLGTQNAQMTYYNGYREKVRDLKNQYKKWVLVQENKRTLCIIKKELQEQETGLELLKLQIAQFEILENVLRLKMQLYTTIVHLYELSELLEVVPFQFEQDEEPEVLITSSESGFDIAFQMEFLKAKDIGKVYILAEEEYLKAYWEAAGFTVYILNTQTTQISLHKWIQQEYQLLKTQT